MTGEGYREGKREEEGGSGSGRGGRLRGRGERRGKDRPTIVKRGGGGGRRRGDEAEGKAARGGAMAWDRVREETGGKRSGIRDHLERFLAVRWRSDRVRMGCLLHAILGVR